MKKKNTITEKKEKVRKLTIAEENQILQARLLTALTPICCNSCRKQKLVAVTLFENRIIIFKCDSCGVLSTLPLEVSENIKTIVLK